MNNDADGQFLVELALERIVQARCDAKLPPEEAQGMLINLVKAAASSDPENLASTARSAVLRVKDLYASHRGSDRAAGDW